MKRLHHSRVSLQPLLTPALAVLLLAPAGVAFAGSPDSFSLVGIVRDFREHSVPGGHPDFERMPENGPGIYAGLVHHQAVNRKPVYTGQGYQVLQQPTDKDGRPIAWHMYNSYIVCHSGMPDEDCIVLNDSTGKPRFEICFVSVEFTTAGHSTWSYTVRELYCQPGQNPCPYGNRDLSHWNLKLDPSHTVIGWTPTSSHPHIQQVSVGVDGSTGLYSIKWDVTDPFGDDGQPVLFTVTLDKEYFGGTIATGVLAKGGNKPDSGDFFGPTTSLSTNGTAFNPVFSLTYDADLEDVPGELGEYDSGGIESAESFAQWFRDVPGTNMSLPLSITFTRQGNAYTYDSTTDERFADLDGFFPIENQLYGQSGDHNFHFTVEMHGDFTFDAAGPGFVHVASDGDMWVFINNMLVIDLGGVSSGVDEQYIDLSRLCMDDGERYRMSVFFTQRHRPDSHFRITTDVELESREVPTVTAMFD